MRASIGPVLWLSHPHTEYYNNSATLKASTRPLLTVNVAFLLTDKMAGLLSL